MTDMLNRAAYVLVAVVTFMAACIAQADPPARVARLSYTSGAVSFAPAGEDEWVEARMNRPLVNGDRLWTDEGARAEAQLGSAALRFAPLTSATVLNVDERIAQFQIVQGTLDVDVRSLGRDETVEIDTPNLAFSIVRPGRYRIDVDERGDTTAVAVRNGRADVFGDSVAYTIDAGQYYRFSGARLAVVESGALPPVDPFDAWANAREQRQARATATRYVSSNVVGYEDLDEYGSWRAVAGYGSVWAPRDVPSGWAPYRYGHWAWIEPWGWTWVDDAPWGFAPFHYGRWALIESRWCWVPGPLNVQPVYAPALVAFIGGPNFQLSLALGGAMSGVAWFPLGPGEVYRPAYSVSRQYFTNVNVSNTQINTTYVTNIYNNPTNVTQVNYINRQIPAAVTAVPTTAFTQSQPVARAAVAVNREALVKASVVEAAPIAPTRASITGAARVAANKPAAAVLARPVVAKAEPPAPPPPFATRQATLQANAGKPLPAEETAKSLPRRERSQVRVVAPAPSAATAPPPQAAGTQQPRRGVGAAPPDREERAARPPQAAEPGAAAPRARAPDATRERPTPPEATKRAPETAKEARRPAPPEATARAPETAKEGRQRDQASTREAPRRPESAPREPAERSSTPLQAAERAAPRGRPPEATRERPARTEPAARAPESARERTGPPPAPPVTAERARPPGATTETPRGRAQARPPEEARDSRPRGAPETPRSASRQPEQAKEELRAAPEVAPQHAARPPARGPERRQSSPKDNQEDEDKRKEKG